MSHMEKIALMGKKYSTAWWHAKFQWDVFHPWENQKQAEKALRGRHSDVWRSEFKRRYDDRKETYKSYGFRLKFDY